MQACGFEICVQCTNARSVVAPTHACNLQCTLVRVRLETNLKKSASKGVLKDIPNPNATRSGVPKGRQRVAKRKTDYVATKRELSRTISACRRLLLERICWSLGAFKTLFTHKDRRNASQAPGFLPQPHKLQRFHRAAVKCAFGRTN
ncbi:unnamed protein product [Ixodes persulcatus]